MAHENIDEQIQEALQEDEEQTDSGDAPVEGATQEEVEHARRIALEECLHTIANYAIELEAGQRESITAEDIRIAFSTHDVEEIWDEAKIFFGAIDFSQDLGGDDEGPGEDAEEDEEAGEA